ncbi:uncharacterized protein LOC112348860 isoform X1 [Selaginella moellendorffii]|uniref:uncharacterized protein LOC112348860 isoform X1 n=1 Tax=Selaginella moellendorffii TaxID=88036 RepID=UPI000D1CAB68|nr:uncharacterized protein LOC112348860 isoform X1 [Selaginella moellendorffii]|eukprot:XP_024537923.1 uncharacterized protein LOC112348860 isoform X1 [Selaginella moellendorffii]
MRGRFLSCSTLFLFFCACLEIVVLFLADTTHTSIVFIALWEPRQSLYRNLADFSMYFSFTGGCQGPGGCSRVDRLRHIYVPLAEVGGKENSGAKLRVNVLFQGMLSKDTGDSRFNCQKLKLPDGCG